MHPWLVSVVLSAALGATSAPTSAWATPAWTDAAQARAMIDAVAANASASTDAVGNLGALLRVQPTAQISAQIKRPPLVTDQPGKLVSTELQLALTQLAIHAGTNNQIRVLRAQGDRRDALILQSGVASLQELAAIGKAQGLDGISQNGDVVRLTRPLVVWLGAGLRLEPGDQLQMDARSGAFLLGFGQIEMVGATVTTSGYATAANAYRPFVLITGQGTIFAQDSTFSGLGMVGADPFGGLMVSQRGLFAPEFPPTLDGNVFHDMGVVGMSGVTGGIITSNSVTLGRGGGLALAAVQGAVVAGNNVTTTMGGAGIKVVNGANVQVTGNLVTRGARNGISIGGNSKGVEISGNAVLANAETGIATQRATCVLVTGNSIAKNGASGLRLNESGISRVQGNALVMNTTAGLNVSAQTKGGRIEISDNLLAANRVGLTGVAIGEVVLDQNNLSAQMPRLFDGEFSQYLAGYLTEVQQQSDTDFRIAPRDGQEADAFLTACNKG